MLRPGWPPDRPTYEAEDSPQTVHFAALDERGEVLAVGSVMPEAHPRAPRPGDWRVRGMATQEDARGRGLGAAILARCEQRARAGGGRRLWCNARVGARSLYERAGMRAEGDVFELPEIGPHLLMSKLLA